MWKLLNILYHAISYMLFFAILWGASYKLLALFLFRNSVPFTIELLLVVLSLFLLRNYHPYDLPHWPKEK